MSPTGEGKARASGPAGVRAAAQIGPAAGHRGAPVKDGQPDVAVTLAGEGDARKRGLRRGTPAANAAATRLTTLYVACSSAASCGAGSGVSSAPSAKVRESPI